MAVEVFVAIDDLPDYDSSDGAGKNNYLQRTFIKAEDVRKLNWKARSYRGLAIKNEKSDKVGVLMMESKAPDGLKKITPDMLWAETEYLQFLLA